MIIILITIIKENKLLLEQVGIYIYITVVVIISTIIINIIVVKKNKLLKVDNNIIFIVTDIVMIMVMVLIKVIINKNTSHVARGCKGLPGCFGTLFFHICLFDRGEGV